MLWCADAEPANSRTVRMPEAIVRELMGCSFIASGGPYPHEARFTRWARSVPYTLYVPRAKRFLENRPLAGSTKPALGPLADPVVPLNADSVASGPAVAG